MTWTKNYKEYEINGTTYWREQYKEKDMNVYLWRYGYVIHKPLPCHFKKYSNE